eukprot:TRINITY_DN57833_c0_g1_i2.p1 TRINITY_DN57833_c0_g1~~TRINITY_DN57833_c0_g1_i2.p1  ORF type:complete len:264 (+),score=45.85 TRINITY_DN57833_c0_g1_i2:1-792(+)
MWFLFFCVYCFDHISRLCVVVFFFFKQKTAYEMLRSLVGSEMCIRDSWYRPGTETSSWTPPLGGHEPWRQVLHKETGEMYWWDMATGRTQWTVPEHLGGVRRWSEKETVKLEGTLIAGPDWFIDKTKAALGILLERVPAAMERIDHYVKVIELGEHSGMWAYEPRPRYEVAEATARTSLTWYASTIAHDATHSMLYHINAPRFQGVNSEELSACWVGVRAEKECNLFQLHVLEALHAPCHEIEYMRAQDGRHGQQHHHFRQPW